MYTASFYLYVLLLLLLSPSSLLHSQRASDEGVNGASRDREKAFCQSLSLSFSCHLSFSPPPQRFWFSLFFLKFFYLFFPSLLIFSSLFFLLLSSLRCPPYSVLILPCRHHYREIFLLLLLLKLSVLSSFCFLTCDRVSGTVDA